MKIRPKDVIVAVVAVALLAGLIAFAGGVFSSGRSTSQTVESQGAAPDGPDPGPDPSPLIDPDDLMSGGPPPDGIPPIDEPTFVSADNVDFLEAREPVIAVEIDGVSRAYPLQILTWHEIVNDTLAGTPVSVTYCPLCNTGIVFSRPTIEGQRLDFGTSGMLYHSNLVMYDRQTESLWPQATGQAVQGPLTGTQLEFLPSQIVSWEDWKQKNPGGQVLSRDTGADRPYGSNPYPGYDAKGATPYLFDGKPDPRLGALERVLGLVGEEDLIAVPFDLMTDRARAGGGQAAVLDTELDGEPVVILWKSGTRSALDEEQIAASADVGAAGAFTPVLDGRPLKFQVRDGAFVDTRTGSRWNIFGQAVEGSLSGSQLPPVLSINSFWFDWAAFHPNTSVLR